VAAALFQFDLSPFAYPQDVVVAQATLRIYSQSRTNPASLSASAYAVNRPWTASAATWQRADATTAWAQAGCNGVPQDRAGTGSTAAFISSLDTWASFDVTSIVQGWLDGSQPNDGIILKGLGGDAVGYDFASVDNGDSSVRPVLQVVFVVIPTPTPTATSTPTPVRPALEVMKTGPAGPVIVGSEALAYTITVANDGTQAASSLVITDDLPLGAQFVNASPGAIFDSAQGQVVWRFDSLAINESVQVTLTVNLATWIGDIGTITNFARASCVGQGVVEAYWETSVIPSAPTPTPSAKRLYLVGIYQRFQHPR